MKEIKCPNCGEVFQVDETGYAQILQQVRDKEFEKELSRREEELKKKHESDLKLVSIEQEHSYDLEIAKKEDEIRDREREIEQLKSQIEKNNTEKELAVAKAVREKETELSAKTNKITELESQLSSKDSEKELAVAKAVTEKEREISEKSNQIIQLSSELTNKDNEIQLKEKSIKEQYEIQLKAKDEQIEYYKDFKARQSTKMVGESLEQHCLTQFNTIRMSAFPTAYFEKDNDARTGSKGDFIFRDTSEDGTEYISIMFEMKNEMDTTVAKHKNEDFFKELDKDRREKKCEYAVLVSLLEIDNDFYNNGIVDVSYKYPKMYVIRPQFFIPIITLLRNAALNSLKYQQELQRIKNQQLDIYNFEQNLEEFKDGFATSFKHASDRFEDAISGIDKAISQLTKIRENLVKSENHLNTANNKLDGITIKKLTKNAPSVKAMFDEMSSDKVNE